MSRERTPWRALVSLGAQLGVAPAAFWRLSLSEWRALVAPAPHNTLPRNAFDAMAAQFPDET